jgi:hypothetical protein
LQTQQHDGKAPRGGQMDALMLQEIEGWQIELLEIQLRRELDEEMTIEEEREVLVAREKRSKKRRAGIEEKLRELRKKRGEM